MGARAGAAGPEPSPRCGSRHGPPRGGTPRGTVGRWPARPGCLLQPGAGVFWGGVTGPAPSWSRHRPELMILERSDSVTPQLQFSSFLSLLFVFYLLFPSLTPLQKTPIYVWTCCPCPDFHRNSTVPNQGLSLRASFSDVL